MSAWRNSIEWKSRRRGVPEWLELRWCAGDLSEEHDLDRFDYIILAAVNDKEVSSLINASSKACILLEKSLYDCAS